MDRRSAGKTTNEGETNMRTKLRSKFTLLFMTFAVLLAIPAVALADTLIVNDLVTNTDTSKAPGGTGTANVWLNTTNGDPSGDTNGCNAATATATATATGQAATVTLSSTNSAISFPNGASAALTACGSENAKQIAYKVADDAQAGQAVIKGAVTGGKSGQTNLYNVNDALTVTITAPAKQNTAVSNVPGGTANWSFAGNDNHKATSSSVAIQIAKVATTTTVSCDTGPFTYNGSAQEPCSASVTGPGGLNQSLTVSYQGNTNAGQATASASYAESGNYESSNGSKNFTIDARPITITADAKSKFFGDTDPALTYQRTSGTLVGNDQITGSLTRDSGEAPGQYSILQDSVSAGQNYAINYVGAKLTIGAWTTKGFYAPVDMRDSAGNIMVNTVKGGSTVPMKFELFKGATELKDVSAVKSTTYTKSAACNGAYTDEIEVVMTGNTSLRFDATGDQFIYNWKTPTGAGCYKVTMTALDGSSLSAYFKTR